MGLYKTCFWGFSAHGILYDFSFSRFSKSFQLFAVQSTATLQIQFFLQLSIHVMSCMCICELSPHVHDKNFFQRRRSNFVESVEGTLQNFQSPRMRLKAGHLNPVIAVIQDGNHGLGSRIHRHLQSKGFRDGHG